MLGEPVAVIFEALGTGIPMGYFIERYTSRKV
jgi:hypothetical protein